MLNSIVYVVAFAAALSVVAMCLEHLAVSRRQPRRLAWALAMLCSALLPPLMMLKAGADQTAAPVVAEILLTKPGSTIAVANSLAAPAAHPISPAAAASESPASEPTLAWQLSAASRSSLLTAWAVISGAMLAFMAGTGLLLWRRSSSWQRAVIQGHEVLVSEDTGPALLGTLRPRVVVPRWFMDEPPDAQSLILEHEQQHIAARDPLLLRVAMLVAIAAPWNLPFWWQLRRLRLAIELDCDARVMRGGAESIRYGEVLLGVTQRATAMPVGVTAMSEPVSALEQRIRSLSPAHGRHAMLRMIGALSLAVAGIGAAAALEVPAFQQMAQAPVVRPAGPATATAPATRTAPETREVPATPASPTAPASDAAPAQQSGAEGHVQTAMELQDSVVVRDCAAARLWCRETAIRLAFARDTVIDDRTNKDGTYVDPLTFGKRICRVTRDGVQAPDTAGGTPFDLEALKALAKDCKPHNFSGPPRQADVGDLNTIPPDILRRMEVVTGGASATYGSGALASVVNLVLNPRLKGFKLNVDQGVNPDQFQFSIGTAFPVGAPEGARAAALGVDNFLITIIPGENTRAASPQVRFDQFVGDDTEVVTAIITMQVQGLWNPQVLTAPLTRLISPSGRLSETPDGTSLVVEDTWANVRSIAAELQGQSGRR